MTRLSPATAEERAMLQALDEAPLPPEEFMRQVCAPMSDAERDEVAALAAWFLRRYPTGSERLAYVRRAWRRWTAPLTDPSVPREARARPSRAT